MGQNKALMPFMSIPLISYVNTRVSKLTDDVFVTADEADIYRDLGFTCFPDVLPGVGALGGLLTALHYARYPFLSVVACDMPFVNPAIIAAAYELLLTGGWDAVVPETEKGYEPMHAVFRVSSCLPAVLDAVRDGRRRMVAWFPAVNIRPLGENEYRQYDPEGAAFLNVNTPDQFLTAESLARKVERQH